MNNPMNEILFLCRNNYVFISVLFYSNFLYFKPLFAGDDGKKCFKGGSWSVCLWKATVENSGRETTERHVCQGWLLV